MKNTFTCLCIAAVAVLFNPAVGNAAHPLTIVTVGDSTVADYPQTDIKRGWGQVIGDYLAPSVKIVNVAECGRSTKTFFDTNHWKEALDAKPDYIFIQFGHNDSHAKDKPESTDANTDYQEYLRRYIKEARETGAKPILVTPMHRVMFASSGQMTQELLPYADAMKHVAAETNTPIIDLYALSDHALQPLGNSGVEGLTASDQDRTHFTDKGAHIIAKLVAEAAGKIDPLLQKQETAARP